MQILLIHNFYQQPGGEDQVFAAESRMLEDRGHSVYRYTVHNKQVTQYGKLALARATVWNRTSYRELRSLIQRECPDVMHVHNTFPLVSPAAYYAARAEGIPVVQTLHNFRLFCPNACFFRQGHVCEDCINKLVSWPGVLHACYRRSRAGSVVTASMLWVHRVLSTYKRLVDVYIALTDFSRRKFIQGGLPAEKIVIKPNFVDPDPGIGSGRGGYALFVGRLSPEKGVNTLLSAWEKTDIKIPLKIVGDGPLASDVAAVAQRNPQVEWLGHRPRQFVFDLMKDGIVLIFPSVCYENFSLTISESYAVGLPVIASKLGSMSSLIDHNHTGLHFSPGNAEELAKQVDWIVSHPAELKRMRQEARARYEANYTAEHNYKKLIEIYQNATERAKSNSNVA